jgi:hypothetical protein
MSKQQQQQQQSPTAQASSGKFLEIIAETQSIDGDKGDKANAAGKTTTAGGGGVGARSGRSVSESSDQGHGVLARKSGGVCEGETSSGSGGDPARELDQKRLKASSALGHSRQTSLRPSNGPSLKVKTDEAARPNTVMGTTGT